MVVSSTQHYISGYLGSAGTLFMVHRRGMLVKIRRGGNIVGLGGQEAIAGRGRGGRRGGGAVQDAGNVIWMHAYLEGGPFNMREI